MRILGAKNVWNIILHLAMHSPAVLEAELAGHKAADAGL